MLQENERTCPLCGGTVLYLDKVKRLVRGKHGVKEWITLKRFKCVNCGSIHRELNERVAPYKQYDIDIFEGVKEGLITEETLGFEDYPCEATMKRWRTSHEKQGV